MDGAQNMQWLLSIGGASQLYCCNYVCKQNHSEIIFINYISKEFSKLNSMILERLWKNKCSHPFRVGDLTGTTSIRAIC